MKVVTLASVAATPVIWTLLGYQFEAASMVAGLLSCGMVRVYMGASAKTRQGILVDLSVTVLTLLFTAGAIASQRPTPFFALMAGTGFGGLGAGIIQIAIRYVKKFDEITASDDAKKEPVGDEEAIRRLMEMLHDVKERDGGDGN